MTEAEILQLLHSMSLKEKAYQLTQVPGTFYVKNAQFSGTAVENDLDEQELALMGSTLYVCGPDEMKRVQERCMSVQPHHIPMLFMMDVIHGFRTVFPIPLAMGCTFDPNSAAEMMRVSAAEASAAGIHVAFSPMLDLVRDPRWGRVMESTGEDPFLNGVMGRAMVEGLQGNEPMQIAKGHLSSCIKHFAAYGAPEGGRDYQNSELSLHTLLGQYLPAYKAAVDAGADMVMSSFQTWNGLPSTANTWLRRDILRKEWGFQGLVITDWAAIAELVQHGVCENLKEATLIAFKAGVDIDMCSMAYYRYLPELVREGKILESDVDQSVLRVLKLKNKLGLFENPYKDANAEHMHNIVLCPEHRLAARKAVQKSAVLLKNDGKEPLLPLSPKQKIALIGPYANCRELHSAWAPNGLAEDAVSVLQAAREQAGFHISYGPGCRMDTREDLTQYSREAWIGQLRAGAETGGPPKDEEAKQEAVRLAQRSDCVVLLLGEHRSLSGEGASRADITLPPRQIDLLRAIAAANPNIVTVLFGGRPLDMREICRLSRSVVMAWLPGTEGGHGIWDLLTGDVNFSAKLSMSVPVSVGQIPVSYNQLRTGRPKPGDCKDPSYLSAYIDTPNAPLFPFGYGLSYSSFEISPVRLSADTAAGAYLPDDAETELISAWVEVKNTSGRSGTATVQLYIRDDTALLARPAKELKAFRQVHLLAGEKQAVSFKITPSMLSFVGPNGTLILEPGSFTLWIGEDSDAEKSARFQLTSSKSL